MNELFVKLQEWFRDYASLMSFMPEWLADLIAPIINLFKDLSAE